MPNDRSDSFSSFAILTEPFGHDNQDGFESYVREKTFSDMTHQESIQLSSIISHLHMRNDRRSFVRSLMSHFVGLVSQADLICSTRCYDR